MAHSTWEAWRSRARPTEVGGLSVATYDLGDRDGPSATFLHGYPSSSMDVAVVAERLDGWRILTLDLPGFGASAKPADHRYSIEACADAVEATWAAAGVTSTVLLAHDYGATVGQELVARIRDGALSVSVDGVVWMNGGVYGELHRPTFGQQMLLDPEHGPDVAATLTEELFVGGVEGTWGTRVPFDRSAAGEMWRSMDDGGGVARMHDLLHYVADRRTHAARWEGALESAIVPMTFVWGDTDPVSGAHMVERVVERCPSASIVRMEDVGHWPPLEAPDEVAAAAAALIG